MLIMPKAHPKGLRVGVVAVAERRGAGVMVKQIAEDFGCSETCLRNWLCKAEIEAQSLPRSTGAESMKLRDLRKRLRVLEPEI